MAATTTTTGSDWSSKDSCHKVRVSCKAWMNDPQHRAIVTIHKSAVTSLATDILSRHQQSSSSTAESASASPIAIEWDEEQWHYLPSPQLSKEIAFERLALYILAMDAINFCFWPSHQLSSSQTTTTASDSDSEAAVADNFEYNHLAMAMARMAQQDEDYQIANPTVLSANYIFAPARLASMSLEEMTKLWDAHLTKLSGSSSISSSSSDKGDDQNQKPITPLDNMKTRCRLWNEVGRGLVEKWDGRILKFLEANPTATTTDSSSSSSSSLSSLSAPQLVDRILESFPGFRDCCPWKPTSSSSQDSDCNGNTHLCLYKRAQICVGDWNASLKLQLDGLGQVTTFADYRVPQLLRHVGVLQYGDSLGERVDRGIEIMQSSEEEKTIRAATVVAVEDLVQELRKQQQQASTSDGTPLAADAEQTFTAITVDWYLWQVGERMHNEGSLKCHHKTRTTFY